MVIKTNILFQFRLVDSKMTTSTSKVMFKLEPFSEYQYHPRKTLEW